MQFKTVLKRWINSGDFVRNYHRKKERKSGLILLEEKGRNGGKVGGKLMKGRKRFEEEWKKGRKKMNKG